MDSSFLIWPSFVLGLVSLLLFGKMLIQFGLPKHPLKFFAYSITLSWTLLWIGASLVQLDVMDMNTWTRWKAVFLLWPALGLLMEMISQLGQFSLIQQRLMTRFPIIGSLVALSFMPQWVPFLVGFFLLLVLAIFFIQVGRFRYHKRLFIKFLFLLAMTGLSPFLPEVFRPWYLMVVLLGSGIYFFLLQNTFCVTAHLEQYEAKETGL